MNKISKLFINENIKTWKKFSTKLLIFVIILALFGTLGLTKLMQKLNQGIEYIEDDYDWKEYVQEELNSYKEELNKNKLDDETKKAFEITIQKYELALQYNITPYGDYWKSDVLNTIAELKLEKEETPWDTTELEKQIQEATEILKNDDFAKYMELQKQIAKQELENKEITQQEYDDKIEIIDLKTKYEIGKNENEEYWKMAIISEIEMLQKNIRTGIDQNTNKVLTVEKKNEQEDTIKMDKYRLEHNMPSLDYTENYRTIFETLAPSFVTAIIAIAAVIIAGGSISTEVSTGTIKFWALTPNKRWKILTAKLLSVLFYIIVITLVVSLLNVVCSNIFFTEAANEYIYVKDGEVKTIGNTLYIIETYFAKIIPVIIFTLFALMLSTVTRNTAVAVSFSVAVYMGNGIFMSIVNQFIKKDWVRYIPFNNLNIADKIFANAQNPMAMLTNSFATSTSLQFSLAVLGVCAILMLITMYDSFNNKDII